jgi:hypothetical protein
MNDYAALSIFLTNHLSLTKQADELKFVSELALFSSTKD